MKYLKIIKEYWQVFNDRNWQELPEFFQPAAKITWPNTKEEFSVADFVAVNQNYPGKWTVELLRYEESVNSAVCVVTVSDGSLTFYAVSFFDWENDKIAGLCEYYSEVTAPPAWR